MGRPWSLVLLAGCGRVAFDPTSDARSDAPGEDAFVCVAPAGHDEDADGLDDACDPCPEVAGSQPDADGDGIGDACNWEPTDVAYFARFTTP